MARDPSAFVGKTTDHIWTEDNGTEVPYTGLIQKVKPRRQCDVSSYWNAASGDTYEDSVDNDVKYS